MCSFGGYYIFPTKIIVDLTNLTKSTDVFPVYAPL